MPSVTVSSKYQVVIPKEIRKELNIRPGEKFEIVSSDHRLEFLPIRAVKDMRGFLKGINTTVERERDRL